MKYNLIAKTSEYTDFILIKNKKYLCTFGKVYTAHPEEQRHNCKKKVIPQKRQLCFCFISYYWLTKQY